MRLLVGDTGVVGKSLLEQRHFDLTFNSRNSKYIADNSVSNDELWLSCLPAAKWQVNRQIDKDLKTIYDVIQEITIKQYSKVVLISTIDVYCESPLGLTEDDAPRFSKLSYGHNRYLFEMLCKQFIKTDDLKIFRLPAIFNKNIKKNILYDLINNHNIEQINANSSYQWFGLDKLDGFIQGMSELHPHRDTYNLFPEPVPTVELLELFPEHKNNVSFSLDKVEYNYKTNLTDSGYLYTKQNTLDAIEKFINEARGN